jgi:hypothetical protein
MGRGVGTGDYAGMPANTKWTGIGAVVCLLFWFGGWLGEGLLFSKGNGAIGATVGFFGGALLGLFVEHHLSSRWR